MIIVPGDFRRLDLGRGSGRAAFTFLEILFSVIIIGVGFIMIAAIFPVAINQQQATVAEAGAVSVGREAIRLLQTSLDSVQPVTQAFPTQPQVTIPLLPCTANLPSGLGLAVDAIPPNQGAIVPAANFVYPIMPFPNITVTVTGGRNQRINFAQSSLFQMPNPLTFGSTAYYMANPAVLQAWGNQVCTSDPRFAWIGFYRRDSVQTPAITPATYSPSPYAQVWLFICEASTEGRSTYAAPPLTPAGPVTVPGVVSPNIIMGVNVQATATGGMLQFSNPPPGLVVNGAHVLVMNSPDDPYLIGQVLRLGTPLSTISPANPKGLANAWSFSPGGDLNINSVSDPFLAGGVSNLTVFILGAAPDPNPSINPNPANPTVYLGTAQDVAVVTGYVRLNN